MFQLFHIKCQHFRVKCQRFMVNHLGVSPEPALPSPCLRPPSPDPDPHTHADEVGFSRADLTEGKQESSHLPSGLCARLWVLDRCGPWTLVTGPRAAQGCDCVFGDSQGSQESIQGPCQPNVLGHLRPHWVPGTQPPGPRLTSTARGVCHNPDTSGSTSLLHQPRGRRPPFRETQILPPHRSSAPPQAGRSHVVDKGECGSLQWPHETMLNITSL